MTMPTASWLLYAFIISLLSTVFTDSFALTTFASSMEALSATHFGQHQQVLAQTTIASLPSCGPQDVRIKVIYSELNPVDLQKLKGPPKEGQQQHAIPNPPFIPGYGGSGVIQEMGPEVPPEYTVGQRVAFLGDPSRNFGSYATLVVVDYRCIANIPSNVSFREAATVPLAGCTAYEALIQLGLSPRALTIAEEEGVPPDDIATNNKRSLLIVGGAGGVGSWATRLARAWYPNHHQLHIIATASSSDSQAWCTKNGAHVVMGHDEILQKLPGGREGSVDYILCLTEPTPSLFGMLAEVVRPYGTICLVVAGESIRHLDLGFCFFKAVTVTTETVFTSLRTNFSGRFQPFQEISEIMALISSQQVQVPLSPQLNDLNEDWSTALQHGGLLDVLSSEHARGKLVMRISSDHQHQ